MSLAQVEFYLSGGASNTDPNLSLGGAMSATRLKSQSGVFQSSNITGVTFDDGYRNPVGLGTLKYDKFNTTLLWTENGAVENSANAVDVSADGRYLIGGVDPDIGITVDVVAASLSNQNEQDDILIADIGAQLFPDVTEQEMEEGIEQWRLIYVKDLTNADQILSLDFYYEGLQGFISMFPLGLDGTPELLTSDTQTPTVFSTGVTNLFEYTDSPLVMILFPLTSCGVWVKRTIPANTSFDAINTNRIEIE